jgi:hypothetical protein
MIFGGLITILNYEATGGGVIPPPSGSFMITETGILMETEDGNLMIVE